MKPATRKIHGWILVVLSIVLVIGTACAFLSSSSKSVPITLSVGQSATMSVFRLLPTSTPILLRMPEHRRKERDRNRADSQTPNAPTVIQLQTCNGSNTLQVPSNWSAFRRAYLQVWNGVSDTSASITAFPPLPAGNCELTFTVMSVDKRLAGQTVRLMPYPPITFKRVERGYTILSLFAFGWPFFTVILFVYLLIFAVILAWDTHKQQTREAAAR